MSRFHSTNAQAKVQGQDRTWVGGGGLKLATADRIAAQLVRALRGRRSCAEHSRRLGYASNIVRRWESGECFPTAAVFLRAHARTHPQISRAFGEFLKRAPEWLDASDPFAPEGVAALLRDLRGKTPIGVLAARTGLNRYSIGRWLKGTAQPKLPELLCVVEAATLRVLDFVATLVDPSRIPALASEWHKLRRAREVAYEAPWSHAVLRALELDAYQRARPSQATAVLAAQLGLSHDEVDDGLRALAESGQIERNRGKWRVERVLAVDTSADAQRSRALKHAWTRVAADRLERGVPGNYGYSVFAISKHDLGQLKELHLQYVRAMQSLIAASAPAECVALYCTQLLDLSAVARPAYFAPSDAPEQRI
jgi:DNA-binding phage protein